MFLCFLQIVLLPALECPHKLTGQQLLLSEPLPDHPVPGDCYSEQYFFFSTSVNATVCTAQLIMAWDESGFYKALWTLKAAREQVF